MSAVAPPGLAAPLAGSAPLRTALFQTLRFRLILSVALVHVVLMGIFAAAAVHEQSDRIELELLNRSRALISMTAVASTNTVLTEDLGALAEIIQKVERQPDVAYCEIADSRGYILGTTLPDRLGKRLPPRVDQSDSFPLAPGDPTLDLREAIQIEGQTVGTVTLGLSTARMDSAMRKTWLDGSLFILLALVVGSFAAWLLSLATTRKLHDMVEATARIGKGDLDVQLPITSRDEVGMLAIAFNNMVASLKHASEEALREHRQRTQAERLACVGEMSASIAHEIRNPLSAVINSVNLLSGDTLQGEDRSQVIGILNNESHRLNRVLSDFLDFAKIRESQPAPGNLAALIEEIASMLRQDLPPGKNIRVAVTCPPDACLAVFDHDQIRQVVWNLALNAVQAMGDDGLLSFRTARRGGKIVVTVADTGCGIQPDFIKDMTKPFVTGRRDGTGLGLAIVQRILVQHRSQLSVSSELGVGSEISFELDSGG
ncbi:ATP-binding protein [Thiobacillus sp.]|uniref:sensor histidine kinase n=1 Tax=Thiobacillus sp. TaxID=924 RepID=UPI0017A5DC8A|nr:ATP-binding protein [Thiobacillus sp.]MBC2730308.1 HAMP domain-containing protein [Thiobacillus sp.]MBC2739046.1 HAMP domain-containing protein [Thiobacillus sp.]MBC2760667.1 HAMP domain-containing protein [Thiobacillus sp.]